MVQQELFVIVCTTRLPSVLLFDCYNAKKKLILFHFYVRVGAKIGNERPSIQTQGARQKREKFHLPMLYTFSCFFTIVTSLKIDE